MFFQQFWITLVVERLCKYILFFTYYIPTEFFSFFIDLTNWKTILKLFLRIIQFYSTVHCSVTSKAKVIASFFKALEKSIFHPCEPNMAGFVKYGPWSRFVFCFQFSCIRMSHWRNRISCKRLKLLRKAGRL